MDKLDCLTKLLLYFKDSNGEEFAKTCVNKLLTRLEDRKLCTVITHIITGY